MLVSFVDDLVLKFRGEPSLSPWIGPALRGATAMTLKESACVHPPEERRARWTSCGGCPFQRTCSYAMLFEPAPPRAEAEAEGGRKGFDDAARPLSLTPHFPVPAGGGAGLEVPLRVVLAGAAAGDRLGDLLGAVDRAGRERGLGPGKARFDLVGGPARPRTAPLSPADLPASPDALSGRYPRLGVALTSPLVLEYRDPTGDRRGPKLVKTRPSFADLFQASWRVLAGLLPHDGARPPRNYLDWMERARAVAAIDDVYEPFRQARWSSRQQRGYEIEGVVGGGLFADVPAAFVPYLYWGGQLRVGAHRVAGAGGWRLLLD